MMHSMANAETLKRARVEKSDSHPRDSEVANTSQQSRPSHFTKKLKLLYVTRKIKAHHHRFLIL